MVEVGTRWASPPPKARNILFSNEKVAISHRLDIAGRPDAVGSSTRSVHWWMRIVFAAVFVLELAAHWV